LRDRLVLAVSRACFFNYYYMQCDMLTFFLRKDNTAGSFAL